MTNTNQSSTNENLSFQAPKKLKNRLECYAEDNGISQSGAVRMILNQNLPEGEA